MSATIRVIWIVSTTVVLIGLGLLVAVSSGHSGQSALAASAVVKQVSNVPASVAARIGAGRAVVRPTRIAAPALRVDGKPEILFVGAEYCGACATQSWPIVIALSRFGMFSRLRSTRSSSADPFPDTATLSFHGATYRSPYVAFAGVEVRTTQRRGSGYAPLDKLTAVEQRLLDTYATPPGAVSRGAIPFIDFGGRYVADGASYDPNVLEHMSATAIAHALSNPTSPVSRGAVGAANIFAAAICSLSGNEPVRVCSVPAIAAIESSLG